MKLQDHGIMNRQHTWFEFNQFPFQSHLRVHLWATFSAAAIFRSLLVLSLLHCALCDLTVDLDFCRKETSNFCFKLSALLSGIITGERKWPVILFKDLLAVRLEPKVSSTTRSILVVFCLVMHRLCKVTCKAINPAFWNTSWNICRWIWLSFYDFSVDDNKSYTIMKHAYYPLNGETVYSATDSRLVSFLGLDD